MRLTKQRRERGVALIIVLWILALLTVIANNLVFTSRTELLALANTALSMRARLAADAGIHAAIHALVVNTSQTSPPIEDRLRADSVTKHWQFDGFDVEISAADESGKVDLNTASPDLINVLFLAAGATAEAAQVYTDALLDWRDSDDLRRLHGAERQDYEQAGRAGQIANADLVAIEELQSVIGITPEIFQRVIAMATVHSGLPGIDPRFANGALLNALPGANDDMVSQYLEQRHVALAQAAPVPPFPAALNLQSAGPARATNIKSTVVFGDNYRLSREAVVQISGLAGQPYRILRLGNIQSPPISSSEALDRP